MYKKIRETVFQRLRIPCFLAKNHEECLLWYVQEVLAHLKKTNLQTDKQTQKETDSSLI